MSPEEEAAFALTELDMMLIDLIEAGLIGELEIRGEPHYRLTDAGMAYAEREFAA